MVPVVRDDVLQLSFVMLKILLFSCLIVRIIFLSILNFLRL